MTTAPVKIGHEPTPPSSPPEEKTPHWKREGAIYTLHAYLSKCRPNEVTVTRLADTQRVFIPADQLATFFTELGQEEAQTVAHRWFTRLHPAVVAERAARREADRGAGGRRAFPFARLAQMNLRRDGAADQHAGDA